MSTRRVAPVPDVRQDPRPAGPDQSRLKSRHSLARRIYSLVAYNLHARRIIGRVSTVRLYGMTLVVPPTVFHPALFFSSTYLADALMEMDLRGKRVLDVGCGSGIVSLVAASRGATVHAIDINPAAVAATIDNSARNGFSQAVTAWGSDLFASLPHGKELYDLIVTNPPFYGGAPMTEAEYAWRAGDDMMFFRRFARDSGRYLASGGNVIVVLSSELDVARALRIFEQNGFSMTLVREQRKLFETFAIYEGVH